MILRPAGHGGLVSPIEFGGDRRKMPAWMWGAIGVSIALHVAGGIFLYSQQFVTMPEEPVDPRIIEVYRVPPPPPIVPPVKPTTHPPTSQNPPIHRPLLDPPTGTETAPWAPNPTGDPLVGPLTHIDPIPVPDPVIEAPPKPPGVIRNPTWVSKPTAAQMERVYPTRPLEEGLGGRVVIQCAVTVSGTLSGCSVASESPAGKGFGSAALRLSKYFKMSPRTVDGAAVEGALVSVPITFSAG